MSLLIVLVEKQFGLVDKYFIIFRKDILVKFFFDVKGGLQNNICFENKVLQRNFIEMFW